MNQIQYRLTWLLKGKKRPDNWYRKYAVRSVNNEHTLCTNRTLKCSRIAGNIVCWKVSGCLAAKPNHFNAHFSFARYGARCTPKYCFCHNWYSIVSELERIRAARSGTWQCVCSKWNSLRLNSPRSWHAYHMPKRYSFIANCQLPSCYHDAQQQAAAITICAPQTINRRHTTSTLILM